MEKPCDGSSNLPRAIYTMNELSKYIPLDKSWIIRMGVLDLINDYKDITNFLEKQQKLCDDLIALKRVAINWPAKKPLEVGESGTLYRFLKFALWKKGEQREFVLSGSLKNRKICDNPDIINWSLEQLLTLDNKTSQWASASVLIGNKEKIENPPYKLKLTYEAVEHWNNKRNSGLCWSAGYDKTIERQALAYLNLLKTGKIAFTPQHSEDYCFARAFGLITPEEAEKRWPSLQGHESNRIKHMEDTLKTADKKEIIDSIDHRAIQAIVMRQKSRHEAVYIRNRNAVNKSWSQFWEFIGYCDSISYRSSAKKTH